MQGKLKENNLPCIDRKVCEWILHIKETPQRKTEVQGKRATRKADKNKGSQWTVILSEQP